MLVFFCVFSLLKMCRYSREMMIKLCVHVTSLPAVTEYVRSDDTYPNALGVLSLDGMLLASFNVQISLINGYGYTTFCLFLLLDEGCN